MSTTVKGKGKKNVATTSAVSQGNDKVMSTKQAEAAERQAQFLARQERKRLRIAAMGLDSGQAQTAAILVARETERASIVQLDATQSDGKINDFQRLLDTGNDYARAVKPAHFDRAPVWCGEKDWKAAKRAFLREFAVSADIPKDGDGRYILPLPMTGGRYIAVVASGDIASVLRFAGWKETDAMFSILASMDHTAPEVASVYRAAVTLRKSESQLTRAQATVDAAGSDERAAAEKRRDAKRAARDTARGTFADRWCAALSSSVVRRLEVAAKGMGDVDRKAAIEATTAAMGAVQSAPIVPADVVPVVPAGEVVMASAPGISTDVSHVLAPATAPVDAG